MRGSLRYGDRRLLRRRVASAVAPLQRPRERKWGEKRSFHYRLRSGQPQAKRGRPLVKRQRTRHDQLHVGQHQGKPIGCSAIIRDITSSQFVGNPAVKRWKIL